jgi:hypothetical protein
LMFILYPLHCPLLFLFRRNSSYFYSNRTHSLSIGVVNVDEAKGGGVESDCVLIWHLK